MYSVPIQENTDTKNSVFGHFSAVHYKRPEDGLSVFGQKEENFLVIVHKKMFLYLSFLLNDG